MMTQLQQAERFAADVLELQRVFPIVTAIAFRKAMTELAEEVKRAYFSLTPGLP